MGQISADVDSNWGSEVRVDLYRRLARVGGEKNATTQGRLYTALWKGDLRMLSLETEEPQVPLTAQQITRNLSETSSTAETLSATYPVFVMARDRSNPVSREKYSKVFAILRKHLAGEPQLLRPESTSLNANGNIAPTVDIAFFTAKGISAEELSKLVREAVYVPAKTAKKGMFRLSAHGVIFQEGKPLDL